MRKHLIELVMIEIVFLVLGILGGKVWTVLTDTTLIWRSLGTPPGKAVRVVDGDYLAVRVQTLQRQTYFCRLHSRNECWIYNDHPDYSPYVTYYDSPSIGRIYREPPPLAGVVYTRKLYNQLSEYTQVLSIYAITEKGEVYVWQAGLGGLFDPLIYGCGGILVALVCGLICWTYVEWRVKLFQSRRRAAQNGE